MIELNELEDLYESGIVPDDERLNELYEFFSDSDLMLAINGGIFAMFGEREVLIPNKIYRELAGMDFDEWLSTKVKPYVDKELLAMFRMKSASYQKLYDALNAEYNPLYNVDATESKSYQKDNSGTQGNTNIKSGNMTDNVAYTGKETDTNTETGDIIDSNTKYGSETETTTYKGAELDTTTKSGNEVLSKVGGEINSTTTFDSVTPQETTRQMSANPTSDTTTYNNVQDKNYKVFGTDSSGTIDTNLSRKDMHEKSYLNYEDRNSRSFGTDGHIIENEKEFTNRADNRTVTYNNVQDANTRTDNLKEVYAESVRRYGNIGVTKSTDLIESEILLREKYNIAEMIARDMANFICYLC